MKVERANADELDDVVAVLSEAAAWLSSRGIEHWPDPYPADWVAPSTERGEMPRAAAPLLRGAGLRPSRGHDDRGFPDEPLRAPVPGARLEES